MNIRDFLTPFDGTLETLKKIQLQGSIRLWMYSGNLYHAELRVIPEDDIFAFSNPETGRTLLAHDLENSLKELQAYSPKTSDIIRLFDEEIEEVPVGFSCPDCDSPAVSIQNIVPIPESEGKHWFSCPACAMSGPQKSTKQGAIDSLIGFGGKENPAAGHRWIPVTPKWTSKS